MKLQKILTKKDQLIGCNYDLQISNAKDVSEYLKNIYTAKNIDYNKFNSDLNKLQYSWQSEKDFHLNPHKEIYEYQNFFMLKTTSDEYILLDGFRRLLWYDAPNTDIFIRTYNQKDLTNKQILTLLVYLNHFKFYGGGGYLERGFGLLLNSLFNIDISNFKSVFDAYLSVDYKHHSYSSNKKEKTAKNIDVKNKILNDNFIEDILFIQEVNASGLMVNSFFGSLIYKLRIENPSKLFESVKFIESVKSNNILMDLMVKYEKIGTNDSAASIKIVNQILEMYENIFQSMLTGLVNEKSYAEKMQECKDIVAKLKKDKSLVKMSGYQSPYKIEKALQLKINNNEVIKFVCVVYPNPERNYFEHGILKYEIKHLGYNKHTVYTKQDFGFLTTEHETFHVKNFAGRFTHEMPFKEIYGHTKKFNNTTHKIDLFVELPKESLV